jgi:hypothetical protein
MGGKSPGKSYPIRIDLVRRLQTGKYSVSGVGKNPEKAGGS